ncbi:hypothetical protein GEMRC1_004585 [Eukaryota sp. GEM-RC1]
MSKDEPINSSHPVKTRHLSIWFLIALNFAQLAIQIGFAVEFAFLMRFLEDELLLPPLASSLSFLAGPLSGFIVNPIMGALSDKCRSKMGRRRPFVIGGSLLTSFSLLLVGCTYPFIKYFGNSTVALITILTGLWLLNIGLNTLQTPSRALVTDVVSRLTNDSVHEQTRAQSVCGLAMSTAQVFTNYMIFYSAADADSIFRIPITDFQWTMIYVFGGSAVAVIAVCIPSLIVGKEEQLKDVHDEEQSGFSSMLKQLGTAVVKSTPSVRLLGLVFFLSWAGFFPFQLFITKALDLKSGSLALTFMSVGSFCMSILCPKLTLWLGHKLLYCVAQLLGAAGLIIPFFIDEKYVLWGCYFAVGLSFCAINVLPFDILPIIMKENTGTYYSFLNAACVFAQMFVLLLSSLLQQLFGVSKFFVITTFSGWLILAAVLIMFLKMGRGVNVDVGSSTYLLLPE